jgi:hypothetical protein
MKNQQHLGSNNLMKSQLFTLFAVGALSLAGCSSTPTKVDTGPIKAATFNFVRKPSGETPSFAENREPIHALVQDAIANNLTAKGLRRVAGAGDVTVGYLVIVGNNASTMMVNDYFAYGQDASDLQDKAHKAYTGSKNPDFFEAGTLVIDLIDSRMNKLLKRTYVTRPTLRNPPLDVRKARIQEAVDVALKDLRIKP